MCGLFGMASTERHGNSHKRKIAFAEGLVATQFRGMDSTGIALVKHDELTKPAWVYKKAMPAADFVMHKRFIDLISPFSDFRYVIGHDRAATQARVSDNNAHPFQVGHITLVHNGTITNQQELNVFQEAPAPVDSAHVAAAFAKHGAKETLEKLRGGFALVWHDAKDGTLNFARNSAKPLVFGYIQNEGTMFWASELAMLHAILHRNDLKVAGKYKFCSPMVWYRFNPNDLKEYERIPFVQRPLETPTSHTSSAGSQSESAMWASRKGDSDTTTPGSNPSTPTTTPSSTGAASGSDVDGTDPPDHVFTEGETDWTPREQGPAPKTHRRRRNVVRSLRLMGFKYGHLIRLIPVSYVPYSNRQGLHGEMRCEYVADRTKSFWMPAVEKKVWTEALKWGYIYGRVCNIRYDKKKGRQIPVVDFDEESTNKWAWGPAARPTQAPKEAGLLGPFRPSEAISSTEDDETDPPERFRGPFGRWIFPEHWMALTAHGCYSCGEPLSTKEHETIQWVGVNADSPLCPQCTNDDFRLARLMGSYRDSDD